MKSKKILFVTCCVLLFSINNVFASKSIHIQEPPVLVGTPSANENSANDDQSFLDIDERIFDSISYLGSFLETKVESNSLQMVIRYSDDTVYNGSVIKSVDNPNVYLRHGEGTLHTPHGEYTGKWVFDRLFSGVFYNYVDQKYRGEFNDKLEKNGYGEMRYLYNSGGDIKSYKGYWKNNQQNDEEAVFVDQYDNVYLGVWIKGELVAIKECAYANGDVFKGEFDTHTIKPNGHGMIKYKNSQVDSGKWINGKKMSDDSSACLKANSQQSCSTVSGSSQSQPTFSFFTIPKSNTYSK